MFSKWHWMIVQISRQLWARALIYALLAVVTAFSTILFKELIPVDLAGKIGADAVGQNSWNPRFRHAGGDDLFP